MAEDVVRPTCKCHGLPQIKDGHSPTGAQKWQCAVRERARQRELYADPVHAERKRAEFRERWAAMPPAKRQAEALRQYLAQLRLRVERMEAAA